MAHSERESSGGRGIDRAGHTAADPNVAEFLLHALGDVYRALDRMDEAVAAHRRGDCSGGGILRSFSHYNLGVALQLQAGRLDQAIAAYRRADSSSSRN